AGLSGSEGKARVVAAVCTITTIAIKSARGTSLAHFSGAISGNDGIGSGAGTAPTTATPLLSRPAAIPATAAATDPITPPGIFALRGSPTARIARTPSPIASV